MDWPITLLLGLFGGGGLAGIITALATRKSGKVSEIAGRFDDASELDKYVNERIEKAVAPLLARLKTLEENQDEMHAAVRAHSTRLWLWDHGGRPGDVPMLPAPILKLLELDHLIPHPAPDTKETS